MRIKLRNLFSVPTATAKGDGQLLHLRIEGMICDI